MPLALTVFGVGKPGEQSRVCYVFVRSVRGPGNYPKPTLPKDAQTDSITRTRLIGFDLEMVAWDHVLDEGMAAAVEEAVSEGHLQLPATCPIEGDRLLEGPIFGPLLVDEKPHRLRFAGVGNLLIRGMSISGEPAGLLQHLSATVGKYKLPHALAQLVDLLAVETGLGEFFIERRRLGLVEHVYRLDNSQQALSLEIHPDKPDLRSRDPMRRVVVKRNALLQGQALRLHVRLGNYDDTIGDRLVHLPGDAAEVTVEANTHVTDVSIVAFDEAGERVESVGGAFMQGFNFGLAALGTVDELPPPFAGSPSAPDLERRPRLHTTSFAGPSAGDRSGTLDVLRKSTLAINRFIGERTFRGESKWFEADASGQVEVIRWIKAKLESPTTAKAYLVDPFLGTAAGTCQRL